MQKAKYDELTAEEKAHLAAEHQASKKIAKQMPRITARGRIQDTVNTARNMTMLVSGQCSFVDISILHLPALGPEGSRWC